MTLGQSALGVGVTLLVLAVIALWHGPFTAPELCAMGGISMALSAALRWRELRRTPRV